MDALLDALANGADRLRARLLRVPGPKLARAVFVPRGERVAFMGISGVLVALALTLCAPLTVLAIGPLLFGVPHLVADARYLVVRTGLYKRPLAIVACAALVVGLVLGLGVRASLGACAIALVLGRGHAARRIVAAAVVVALFALSSASPWNADVCFAHAHNLVALALWIAWRPRPGRGRWLVVAAACAAGAVVFFGGSPFSSDAAHWSGLSTAELARTLAFPGTNADVARRLVLFFAFAQSVHYVVWLRLIPDDDRPATTPRSFAKSLRALRQDIGRRGVWLACAVTLGILALSCFGIAFARDAYLGVAYAHGHLEIVAAGLLFARGSRPVRRPAALLGAST